MFAAAEQIEHGAFEIEFKNSAEQQLVSLFTLSLRRKPEKKKAENEGDSKCVN